MNAKPSENIIRTAVRGDPLAIQTILRYYRNYIFRLSTYTAHDEYGNTVPIVDMDTVEELEDALISGILGFSVA